MNIERQELIKNLEEVAKNRYELDNEEYAYKLLPLMIKYIGDVDPHLRDDLIYSTFCQWISEKKYFPNEELRKMLNIAIDDDHLFLGIGKENDDSILTRSFSALLINLLLEADNNNTYLSLDEFDKVSDSLIRYFNEEKDLRGYSEDKGWMHGAAHGSDALCEVVISEKCNESTALKVLDSIEHILNNKKYLLFNEEDERMTRVVFIIAVKNKITTEKMCKWINDLGKNISKKYSMEQYIQKCNTKNFIRSLYFSFMHNEKTKQYTELLFKKEEELNKFIPIDESLAKR